MTGPQTASKAGAASSRPLPGKRPPAEGELSARRQAPDTQPARPQAAWRIPADWQLVIGLVLLASAAVLVAVTLADLAEPVAAVVWGGLALASYAAGLLYLFSLRLGHGVGLADWRFGPWMLFWYGLAFGLATITWSQPQTSTPGQIEVFNVVRALGLVAVGVTLWALGYLTGPGRLLRDLAAGLVAALGRRFTGQVRSPLTPWGLYAIGLAARLAGTATSGHFGYVGEVSSAVGSATSYGQILSVLSLCAPLAVAAAAMQVFGEGSRSARITLAVLFMIELAFGAAAGGKQNFVIAVLAVIIPMSAARRRLPLVAIIACVSVFLIVVVPFNSAYRAASRNATGTLTARQAVSQAPEILRQTLTGHSPIDVVPDSVTYLMQRIREIDSPAIILQRTPEQVPFSSPAQLVEAPVADVVPRAVWPGKPTLNTGDQFSQQYYGLPAGLTSSAITPVGDFYRHGGWVVVIAGMFVLGCGIRLLDEVLDVRANPHAIFLVLLLFPALVKSEDDWVSLVAGIPGTLLLWLLAVGLTFRARRQA